MLKKNQVTILTNVFLDLDGVLGAFDEHVEALWGTGPRQLGDAKLWSLVNQDREAFWSGIPLKAGALELFAAAAPYAPTILTGCPYDVDNKDQICPVASSHKIQWIAKHFGPSVPVITCFSRLKPNHMLTTDDILVDDFIVNIKNWQKAGGRTVWYKTAEQAIEDLKRKLETVR
jgi:hypothetical protein